MNKLARLGDVCQIQSGFAFDGQGFSTVLGTPLIRIRDLKTNRPSLMYDGPFPAGYVVTRGDVLVGMDGEFRAYRWGGEDALLNQRVCRLVPTEGVLDRDYLYFAVGSHLREIERTTSLTTMKQIASRQMADIQIH
jgi:type I restriction enzyme S subunit